MQHRVRRWTVDRGPWRMDGGRARAAACHQAIPVTCPPSPNPPHHDFTIILRGAPASLSHCCDALTQPSTTVSLQIPHASPIHPVHPSRSCPCCPADRSPRPTTSTAQQRPWTSVSTFARVSGPPASLASSSWILPRASVAPRAVVHHLQLRAAV